MISYSTRHGRDKSGAYLFLPDGEAQTIKITKPKVLIIEGKMKSEVIVKFPNVEHSVILYNSGGIYFVFYAPSLYYII